MAQNDHDLYAANLPLSFSSTKVSKRRKQKKPQPATEKKAKKRCIAEAENFAEEFRVLEVLARYRAPFTVLMDSEERLAREDESNIEYEGSKIKYDNSKVEYKSKVEYEESIELNYEIDEAIVESIPDSTTADSTTPDSNTPDSTILHKYYQQRYDYFSLFDEGIQIDHEGWYSVTPESIACHTAHELFAIAHVDGAESVVLDAFCGVGGNAIQFAKVFDRVVAVDLSASRLEIARHNATIYGVADKIEFICADAFEFLKEAQTKADLQFQAIFLSPPWGGPEYGSKPTFHPSHDLFSGRGIDLLRLARSITRNCVFFLPRQTDIYAFAQMIQETETVEEADSFVVEQNYLRQRLKAISIYLY